MATIKWTNKFDESLKGKIKELSQRCNETIMGRFSHEIDGETYYFSNDTEAQANFEKADRAFEKGRMSEIPWTAYDGSGNVVRIMFNQVTFESLYISHLNHIQGNISKFRDFLMPQVMSATTVGELDSISW